MNKLKGIYSLLALLLLCQIAIAQTEYVLKVDELNFDELIHHLESHLSIKLAYNSNLSPSQVFTFDHKADNLQSLLEPVWAAANLESQYVTDRQVLIRPMPAIGDQPITYNIKIKDIDHSTPLYMVAIAISGTDYGTYTDANGVASLTVHHHDRGKKIIFHLLGYHEVSITLGNNTSIDIALTKSEIQLDEILIEDRRNILSSMPVELKQELALDQLSLYSSGVLGADLLRSAQLLSGISAHNDRSAGLQIRGSDEDQALIMMDGIPIYNPTHYFGVFSAILQ